MGSDALLAAEALLRSETSPGSWPSSLSSPLSGQEAEDGGGSRAEWRVTCTLRLSETAG